MVSTFNNDNLEKGTKSVYFTKFKTVNELPKFVIFNQNTPVKNSAMFMLTSRGVA